MSDTVVNNTVEIELEIDGEFYEVTFERETTFSIDSDYGADADGRRGVRMEFVEDDNESDVMIAGKPLEEYPQVFQQKADAAIHKWMDENIPTS